MLTQDDFGRRGENLPRFQKQMAAVLPDRCWFLPKLRAGSQRHKKSTSLIIQRTRSQTSTLEILAADMSAFFVHSKAKNSYFFKVIERSDILFDSGSSYIPHIICHSYGQTLKTMLRKTDFLVEYRAVKCHWITQIFVPKLRENVFFSWHEVNSFSNISVTLRNLVCPRSARNWFFYKCILVGQGSVMVSFHVTKSVVFHWFSWHAFVSALRW